MPKIFRQKDIDLMQASEVSQEFVDYFSRLSKERKEEFAVKRPDLYSVISSWSNHSFESNDLSEEFFPNDEKMDILQDAEEPSNESQAHDEKTDEDFKQITSNYYEGADISNLLKEDAKFVEALTIEDNRRICFVHRTPFSEVWKKSRKTNGGILNTRFFHCSACNRLFIESSSRDRDQKDLEEWGIQFNFYDLELSKKYLKSQIKPYELGENEKIFYPEHWIDDNPKCPIHDRSLEELPCIIKFNHKSISFDAFFCMECKKVILRRTGVLELEDECAEIGVPLIESEPLVNNKPSQKSALTRKVKPDYFIENGKRIKYEYGKIDEGYALTEDDTVIVSDSAYCSFVGHQTEILPGLISITEQIGGEKKAYLFKLGYCSECQKYRMVEEDYKLVYKIGRPEVNILIDIADSSYMITSGEVYNFERNHLGLLEERISQEINTIEGSSDYVNPYETLPFYDDGGLAFRKYESKKQYELPRAELLSYISRPYQYRVDISADGKNETYYVGLKDINIDNAHQVISLNSKFGRELVHYQTVKVSKDGTEYGIKLSRQFDIHDA